MSCFARTALGKRKPIFFFFGLVLKKVEKRREIRNEISKDLQEKLLLVEKLRSGCDANEPNLHLYI